MTTRCALQVHGRLKREDWELAVRAVMESSPTVERSWQAQYRSARKSIIFFVMCGAIAAIAGSVLISKDSPYLGWATVACGLMIVSGVVKSYSRKAFVDSVTAQSWDAMRRAEHVWTGEQTITIDERGFEKRRANSLFRYDWDLIDRLWSAEWGVLVGTRDGITHLVPAGHLADCGGPSRFMAEANRLRASMLAERMASVSDFLQTNEFACPGCGNSLRGATDDRCPACGLILSREDLPKATAE